MSDDVRADARRLLQGITPGPWVAEYSREQGNCVIPADARSTREAVAVTRLYHQVADAEFIAAAPKLVDRLLAELDQALATLQQVRELADDLDARAVAIAEANPDHVIHIEQARQHAAMIREAVDGGGDL